MLLQVPVSGANFLIRKKIILAITPAPHYWKRMSSRPPAFGLLAISLFLLGNSVPCHADLVGSDLHAPFACQKAGAFGGSDRYLCQWREPAQTVEVEPHSFTVIVAEGTYAEMSRAHGYLLAEEAENGPISEVLGHVRAGKAKVPRAIEVLGDRLVRCLVDRTFATVSPEYRGATLAFEEGYRTRLRELDPHRKPRFTTADLHLAAVSIDLVTTLEGLLHSHSDRALHEILRNCGGSAARHIPKALLAQVLAFLPRFSPKTMGCTAWVLPSSDGSGEDLIHGRNLDGDLTRTWGKTPILFLMNEKGHDVLGRPFKKYLAGGSAGLIYPGGTSGINEKGISVSMHQLSPVRFVVSSARTGYDIAPYLQQRILREAESIDDAVALLKQARHFAAWTFVVADSKRNESASIEVTSRGVEVARRLQGSPLPQSNHFLGRTNAMEFELPTFHKFLETHSRFETLSRKLPGMISTSDPQTRLQENLDLLANHEDAFLPGFQSFGRTIIKANTAFSSIALPGRNEYWMSVVNQLPAPHGWFAGFRVNWAEMTLSGLGMRRGHSQVPGARITEAALARVTHAKELYDWNQSAQALDEIAGARAMPEQTIQMDPGLQYLHARLLTEQKRYRDALGLWNDLWERRERIHPFQRVRVALFAAFNRMRYTQWSFRRNFTQELKMLFEAEKILISLLEQHPGNADLEHHLSTVRAFQNIREFPSDPHLQELPSEKIEFVLVR